MRYSGPFNAQDPRTWLPDWRKRGSCHSAAVDICQQADEILKKDSSIALTDTLRRWVRENDCGFSRDMERLRAERDAGIGPCVSCGALKSPDDTCARCMPDPGQTLGDVEKWLRSKMTQPGDPFTDLEAEIG